MTTETTHAPRDIANRYACPAWCEGEHDFAADSPVDRMHFGTSLALRLSDNAHGTLELGVGPRFWNDGRLEVFAGQQVDRIVPTVHVSLNDRPTLLLTPYEARTLADHLRAILAALDGQAS